MEMSGGTDDRFEVSPSPDGAAEEAGSEGSNVCRVAALSTMLGNDRLAVRQLERELAQLGFSERLRAAEWSWADVTLADAVGQIRLDDTSVRRQRVARWQAVNESARPGDAIGFIVAVLGSHLERESAAAAAALWRVDQPFSARAFRRGPRWWHLWERLFDLEPDWPEESWWSLPWGEPGFSESALDEAGDLEWDGERWAAICERALSRLGDRYEGALLIRMLSGWRLAQALRSRDPTTRSLAATAFLPGGAGGTEGPPEVTSRSTPPGALVVSTMIHGTWGWKGEWWRPQPNNFHSFILQNHRPNLYSRGAKFSWSGAYRETHRVQAATDFCDWSYEVAPHGLQTVFAHSYGGEVAARATLAGTAVAELVLLSVPATALVETAASRGQRIVDVRLQFDPILALARVRQRLQPRSNVSEVLLQQWRYDHGASHREDVWRTDDVARRGGI